MNETTPLVIYGNHQPGKLKRLLEGLRPQGVKKIIFLLSPPEGEAEKSSRTCLEIINGVDWAETELHSWEMKGKEDPFVEQISLSYSNLMEESPNIHPLGWIQPRSASFYR